MRFPELMSQEELDGTSQRNNKRLLAAILILGPITTLILYLIPKTRTLFWTTS